MRDKSERGNNKLRLLDRYAGIPLVFLLGLLKRKNVLPQNIRKIGILLTAAIGDTVLASAIISDLKKASADVEITLFAGKSNFEAAKMTLADKVVLLDIKNPIRSISIIRQSSFDLWIDMGQWARLNSFFSFFAFALYKVGFKTDGQFRHYVYDLAVPHSKDVHEIENFRELIRACGYIAGSMPVLHYKETPIEQSRYVVFHMFPGGYKSYLKEWGAENWAELVKLCENRFDKIFFTGTKGDIDSVDHVIALSGSSKVFSEAGIYDLAGLASFLKNAAAVVSVNTGVMHLSWALGTKTVGLHGPTSELRWGPLGDNSVSVKSSLECAGCLNLGFEYKCATNKCMNNIKPADVNRHLLKLIGETF